MSSRCRLSAEQVEHVGEPGRPGHAQADPPARGGDQPRRGARAVFLTERARFPTARAPAAAWSTARTAVPAGPSRWARSKSWWPTEGDGWNYVVDALGRDSKRPWPPPTRPCAGPTPRGCSPSGRRPAARPAVPHVEWADCWVCAPASCTWPLASDPPTRPSPPTHDAGGAPSLYHGGGAAGPPTAGARSRRPRRRRQSSAVLRRRAATSANGCGSSPRLPPTPSASGPRRLHLGQVLWTGKDHRHHRLRGRAGRSLGQRRSKRPPPSTWRE